MAFTAKYTARSLQVTASKDELDFLIQNGYVEGRIELGKIPVDAGKATITLSVQAQEVLKQIASAEREVYEDKTPPAPAKPKPAEKEETNDGKAEGPAESSDVAADDLHGV